MVCEDLTFDINEPEEMKMGRFLGGLKEEIR